MSRITRYLSYYRRPLRLLVLVPTILFLAACSHDRYLFLERADLTDIEKQLEQQRQEILSLRALAQQEFDLLETRQQLRQNAVSQSLQRQSELIKQLPPPAAPLLATAASPSVTTDDGRHRGKLIVGEVEPLYLAIPGVRYEARIDSGAATSSLHATNIQRFERDGERWVRFDIDDPENDKPFTLEREITRNVRILQSTSEETERRAVVELPFVIGSHRQSAEFTLTDREHLDYPILIGRNVLRDVMLVDVGRENVTHLPDNLVDSEGGDTD